MITQRLHHDGIPLGATNGGGKILIHMREMAPGVESRSLAVYKKRGDGGCAMTPIERLQNALTTLGLKAVDARLEGLLEQAAKKEPS